MTIAIAIAITIAIAIAIAIAGFGSIQFRVRYPTGQRAIAPAPPREGTRLLLPGTASSGPSGHELAKLSVVPGEARLLPVLPSGQSASCTDITGLRCQSGIG